MVFFYISLVFLIVAFVLKLIIKPISSYEHKKRKKKDRHVKQRSYQQINLEDTSSSRNSLTPSLTNKTNKAFIKYSHYYDNEKFYNELIPRDYLIYQLHFSLTKANDLIKKYEEKENKEEKFVEVTIYLEDASQSVKRFKRDSFTVEEVKEIIKKLSRRQGYFYSDKEMYDAIVRCERAKVSNRMRFSIYKRDHYTCQICHKRYKPDNLEIDHIYPIAKGGKTTYDNLQTLCKRCNKEKGDKVDYK